MRGKYELHIWLLPRNGSNDLIVDNLVIKVIFRLINKDDIIIILSQYKQD